MNILPFVMIMLMLLALLTYARLETYRDSTAFQAIFKYYMQKLEREDINSREISWYELKHATGKKTDATTGKQTKATSSSRLSLYSLLFPDDKDAVQKQLAQTTDLAKKLMIVLYANQPFFIEMEQERPGFMDEILSRIAQAAAALPDDQKFTKSSKTHDLANLDLGDLQLNEVFYKMLKGTPQPDEEEHRPNEDVEESQVKQLDDEVIEAPEGEAAPKPLISSSGFPSLLDYVTIRNSTGVRVYLASRALLTAIYGDPSVADAIISFRNELYQQVNSEAMTAQEAQSELQKRFGNTQAPGTTGTSGTGGTSGTTGTAASFFDFTVSKTNPKPYE